MARTRLRDAFNRFAPATQSERETLLAQRADYERQIAEAEQAYGEAAKAAVRAGMAEHEAAAYRQSNETLTGLRGLLLACDDLIRECDQQERQRQNEAAIRANKTKLNSLTQLVRAFDRLEGHSEKAIAGVIDIRQERHTLAEKIRKLLPATAYNEPAFKRFTSSGIDLQEQREWCRQGYFGQGMSDWRGTPSYPGVDSFKGYALGSPGYEDRVDQMDPMSVHGRLESDWALRTFAASLGLAHDQSPETTARAVAPPMAAGDETRPDALVSPDAGNMVHGEYPNAIYVDAFGKDINEPVTAPVQPASPVQPPGFIFANGRSQLPDDRPRVSAAEMEAAANRTLVSLINAPKAKPSPSDLDKAAEATLKAVQGQKLNPHPEGSEAHAEFEQILADRRARNPAEMAFDAAERRARRATTTSTEE
jgi:hypothetical protein